MTPYMLIPAALNHPFKHAPAWVCGKCNLIYCGAAGDPHPSRLKHISGRDKDFAERCCQIPNCEKCGISIAGGNKYTRCCKECAAKSRKIADCEIERIGLKTSKKITIAEWEAIPGRKGLKFSDDPLTFETVAEFAAHYADAQPKFAWLCRWHHFDLTTVVQDYDYSTEATPEMWQELQAFGVKWGEAAGLGFWLKDASTAVKMEPV